MTITSTRNVRAAGIPSSVPSARIWVITLRQLPGHHRPVLWPRRNHRHPVRLRNVQHPRLTMARRSRAETPRGVAGEYPSNYPGEIPVRRGVRRLLAGG